MKGKAKLIAEKITNIVKEWPSVDSVVMGQLIAEEFYDPYYFLSLDVYFSDGIPPAEERRKSLSFGTVFESSYSKGKDRLLADDVPVRIEYKTVSRITDLIDGKEGFLSTMRDTGTYVFYRILNSDICYDRSGWILRMREKLKNMPQPFWSILRPAFQDRMEHCLSDLGAAAMRSDELFFLISSSNFLQSVCSVLFAVNRRFEPSFRLFSEQVKTLPILPEAFAGRFDTLLRSGSDFAPSRKYEIAEFLAKSILIL
ncbi:MAG: DUF4037 domain-containing protein [Spirochaetales bacterium]|jgi:hypothetical protein|nr:DUF4037 domain-containing protein [Spirochaetales bacterium]